MNTSVPQLFWRSLFLYNLYRFALGTLFVAMVVFLGPSRNVGSENSLLFLVGSALYAILCALSLISTRARWPAFNAQLAFQIVSDVVFISVLMHASGGVRSGLGLLLVASLASTALISRGRMALFYAALASIAALAEQTWRVVYDESTFGDFLQVGLLSMGYFAISILAHRLAAYVQDTEQIAEQRGADLENMAAVNALVIEDMSDGILAVDRQGLIRQHNARAEQLLGLVMPLENGQRLDIRAPQLSDRLRVWRSGQAEEPRVMRTPTGKSLQVRIVDLEAGRHHAALIYLQDMSAIQAHAQQMKLAALGRLTANIAHEIRNPLSAISHASELLREEPGITGTTAPRLLEIIQNNTTRLDRMVQDVLQLSRRDRLQQEEINLNEFLPVFAEEFCQIEKIPPAGVILEIGGAFRVPFDRAHLHQVLWNLCRNAWRHSREQDGSVRLCVSPSLYADTVQLDVIDDGPGVAPENIPKLFEPFFTTDSKGTGLGLYIARELCSANGATLEYIEVAPGGQFRISMREGEG